MTETFTPNTLSDQYDLHAPSITLVSQTTTSSVFLISSLFISWLNQSESHSIIGIFCLLSTKLVCGLSSYAPGILCFLKSASKSANGIDPSSTLILWSLLRTKSVETIVGNLFIIFRVILNKKMIAIFQLLALATAAGYSSSGRSLALTANGWTFEEHQDPSITNSVGSCYQDSYSYYKSFSCTTLTKNCIN